MEKTSSNFHFGVLHPVVLYQGYQENCLSQQLFKAFIVFVLRPLHVSAFTGHHQAEHTI
jgi:hypothetical protein